MTQEPPHFSKKKSYKLNYVKLKFYVLEDLDPKKIIATGPRVFRLSVLTYLACLGIVFKHETCAYYWAVNLAKPNVFSVVPPRYI